MAGAEKADSWITDGHKWLNTPYDGAMAICRDAALMAQTMNSDAAYASAAADSQKNLGLEFSRRARGIPVWAVLRALGRSGVAAMVERHCALARRLADGLRAAGFGVLNRVVLNQVLVHVGDAQTTDAVQRAIVEEGTMWLGATTWRGERLLRISVSSWMTTEGDVERCVEAVGRAVGETGTGDR